MSKREKIANQKLSGKARLIGLVASLLIRSFSITFRWRVEDPDGLLENLPDHPMIWTFWHNRIFAVPTGYRRYLRSRSGAVLTSPSKDGEVVAAVLAAFGVGAVRGSSSRRGAKALLELNDWIQRGYDVGITPDGPRGPRYRLAPGVIKLAQKSGAPILPIRVDYRDTWVLKSWDRFRFPKPFTTVTFCFEKLQQISSELDEEAFEGERLRVQNVLNPKNETD